MTVRLYILPALLIFTSPLYPVCSTLLPPTVNTLSVLKCFSVYGILLYGTLNVIFVLLSSGLAVIPSASYLKSVPLNPFRLIFTIASLFLMLGINVASAVTEFGLPNLYIFPPFNQPLNSSSSVPAIIGVSSPSKLYPCLNLRILLSFAISTAPFTLDILTVSVVSKVIVLICLFT